jgi:hypothetical protein
MPRPLALERNKALSHLVTGSSAVSRTEECTYHEAEKLVNQEYEKLRKKHPYRDLNF